jgi:hypothetical protein
MQQLLICVFLCCQLCLPSSPHSATLQSFLNESTQLDSTNIQIEKLNKKRPYNSIINSCTDIDVDTPSSSPLHNNDLKQMDITHDISNQNISCSQIHPIDPDTTQPITQPSNSQVTNDDPPRIGFELVLSSKSSLREYKWNEQIVDGNKMLILNTIFNV